MSDYNDLFRDFDQQHDPFLPQKPKEDPNHAIQEEFREIRVNRWLIVIYIGVMLLVTGISSLAFVLQFPNVTQTVQNLTVSSPVISTVYDNTNDPNTPYVVTISGSVLNNNAGTIPSLTLNYTLYDTTGATIGTYGITTENLASGATWSYSKVFYLTQDPVSFSRTASLDQNSMFYLIANFLTYFVTAILFLFIDKRHLVKDWQRFKEHVGEHVGQIILGYFFIFVVLILSQLLMTKFGLSTESGNEEAISAMFTLQPLNLSLLFLMLCILTPIVEELVYRKVLYGFFEKRFGVVVAILGSGLIFGFMHVVSFGDFLQAIPYVLMGCVLGYMYYASKKIIYVTMGMHFLNNLYSYVMYILVLVGVLLA